MASLCTTYDTAFTPTKTIFGVAVSGGVVTLEGRYDVNDAFTHFDTITNNKTITNIVGTQYRIVSALNTTATFRVFE
jgi:mRNA-degrading endonuclease HigB of HigAB toxin-antitoxin module